MILPTLEKYELFQCIKSTEQLFTFVVLAFCQLSALKWLSKPMAKGAEEGAWPEARGDKKAVCSQMALGCYRAPACISCCFHLPQELRGEAGLCKEMGTHSCRKRRTAALQWPFKLVQTTRVTRAPRFSVLFPKVTCLHMINSLRWISENIWKDFWSEITKQSHC